LAALAQSAAEGKAAGITCSAGGLWTTATMWRENPSFHTRAVYKSSKEWPHPGVGLVGDTGWLWCRSELLKKELHHWKTGKGFVK
jgi:hypothetical protein